VKLARRKLVVEDEGEGIGSEELVRIFDRYYRASEKPGHGIGLAIVKQFCDENGIEIHIESQKGKGTKVVLDLTHI
jgi:signal transduction histidine kinase